MPFLSTLDPQTLAALQALSLGQSVTLNGVTYSPIGVSTSDGSEIQGYTAFDPSTPLKPGATGELYSATGTDAGKYTVQNGGAMDALTALTLALITGGTAWEAGLLGGGAGAGAGATTGTSGVGTTTAGAGTDIFGGNGMATGFTDTGTAGGALDTGYAGSGAVTGSTVPSVFNAAKDSQLASEQLGLTGADTNYGPGAAPVPGGPGNTPYPIGPDGQPVMTNNNPPGTTPPGVSPPGTTPPTIPGLPGNFLDWLSKLVPGITSLLSGNQGSDLAKEILDRSDPFYKYRAGYGSKLNDLWNDPSTITQMPGYKAGMTAVERSLASQGYTGSGNMMAALQEYGGGFFDKTLDQLETLSGARTTPGNGALGAAQLLSAAQGTQGYGISQLLQAIPGLAQFFNSGGGGGSGNTPVVQPNQPTIPN